MFHDLPVHPSIHTCTCCTPCNMRRLAPAHGLCFQRATRKNARTVVFLVAFLTALGSLLASTGQALVANGAPPSFDVLIANSSGAHAWIGAFFELAVFLALLIKSTLAPEQRQRRAAAGGAALAAFLSLNLALGSSPALRVSSAPYTSIREACRGVMFLTIVAECADGGLGWVAAELLLFTPIAIALSQTNAGYKSGTEFRTLLATASGGWEAVFIIYFILSGMLRTGAMLEDMLANAANALERGWYLVFICIYLALWFSIFGYEEMSDTLGTGQAQFYSTIVYNALLYSFAPLVLVDFLILGRVKELALRQELLRARALETAARASAHAEMVGAAAGRRQFLGFVFHELRVPFAALLLGMQHVAADPRLPADVLTDMAVMDVSAAAMRSVLNDALEAEAVGSGGVTQPSALEITHVRPLLRSLQRSLNPLAQQENVQIEFEVPGPSIPSVVLLDANRLSLLVVNLVRNACKYALRGGGGKVRVRVSSIVDETPAAETAPHVATTAATPLPPTATASVIARLGDLYTSLASRHPASPTDTPLAAEDAVILSLPIPSLPLPLGIETHGAGGSPSVGRSYPTDGGTPSQLQQLASESPPSDESGASPTRRLLRFEIHDNGEGISVTGRLRLLAMFEQLQSGILQSGRGGGLALYLCYETARRMHGRMDVVSHKTRPGWEQGTTFFVDVPLREPRSDSGNAPECAAAAPDTDVSDASIATLRLLRHDSVTSPEPLPPHTRILVVDDDAATRMFLARTLRRLNPQCTVDVAEDGRVAVAAVETSHYDLVSMDKQMPNMEGPEAVRAMRTRGFGGGVIGVTGSLLKEEIEQFKSSGVTVVLGKPVDIPLLQRELRRLLRDQRGDV